MGPFRTLKYLYAGTADFDRDFAYYRDVLGGQVVWNLKAFGAKVAAFRLGQGPLVLLASHRPSPTTMPVFAVDDLETTVAELRRRGWKPLEGPFEIPDGPCYTFEDPSGNPYAVFGDVRPNALLAERKPTVKRIRRRRRGQAGRR